MPEIALAVGGGLLTKCVGAVTQGNLKNCASPLSPSVSRVITSVSDRPQRDFGRSFDAMVLFPDDRLTRQNAAYGVAVLVGGALVIAQALETRAMLRGYQRTLAAYERTQTLYQETHGLYRLMLDHVVASHQPAASSQPPSSSEVPS